MIEAVIFDLGNVLVDFDYTPAAKRMAYFCDKSPEEIVGLFFDAKVTQEFEEGRISAQDFFLNIKKMLNLNLKYEAFVPIWNEVFFLSAKNRAVFALANRLRNNYKTILLSNTNILHYEYLKKNFPVFNVFHHVLTSCEVGYAKPRQEIYQKTLEVLGIPPENVFYTDDRAELVESATKLGIKSFLFTSVEQLKKDLVDSGVNII
ncbi:MAG: HAD family phosphatase [Candidatus Omnitrophica bacterium]|nr:HAD family phosphatase [Candidatus Omnitrophota bacterium]